MARGRKSNYDLNKLSPMGQQIIGSLHALRPASLADRPLPEMFKRTADEKAVEAGETGVPTRERRMALATRLHQARSEPAPYRSAHSAFLKRKPQTPKPRTRSTSTRRAI